MPLQSWALGVGRLKCKTDEPKYVGVVIIIIRTVYIFFNSLYMITL